MRKSQDILKKSKQIKVKKRIGFGFIVAIIAVLIVSGVITFFRLDYFLINKVTVVGNETVNASDLIKRVNEKLTGNYFLIFPKRNIFLFPAKEIKADLLKVFTRTKTLEISQVGFKGLSIAIGERKPEIVWCDGAVSPKCFFADDEGYIFSPAPQYSDNIFYSLVGGLPAEAIGTKPLPTNSFQNIVLFAKLLPDAFKKANFNDGSQLIRVVASTTGEYTAVLRNNKAEWRILFNDGDATETIKNLVSVLSCDAFKQDLSTNKTDLDYLNLRIGKKVFYRFK